MRITVMTASDERIVALEVDGEEPAENVKALLEVETGVPMGSQRLLHNSEELRNEARLGESGVREGDLLMMERVVVAAGGGAGGGGAGSGQGFAGDLSLLPDGSAANPWALQQHLRGNPSAMAQLRAANPGLAQAVLGSDLGELQRLLRERAAAERRRREEMAALDAADPFDLDAQRRIEDLIRQRNVDDNWEAALEHNPEAFARVPMLYVAVALNGVALPAFVDSGAQMSILSTRCARRCGLLRLLDRRFVGVARGVGQSAIVGRIHAAHLAVAGRLFLCSLTVLDQPDVDFILGLDMLRKHQCVVDLKDNVLRVGGGEIAVPFLPEKDIPSQHFSQEAEAVEEAEPSAAPPLAGRSSPPNDRGSEEKVARLMQLGFDRHACVNALQLFDGNEDQAASYLFGG